MAIAIISHNDCLLHQMSTGHPECPERLVAIMQHIKASDIKAQIDWKEASSVDKTLLTLVHKAEYVDYVFEHAPAHGEFQLDPDTLMIPKTLPAALLAAGAAIDAVDLVCQHKYQKVFCAVRPPGHHAEKNKAMGFCFFNNIALAASYALKQYQLQRVAILDFDVHHGNGTQDIFNNCPQVLFCSSFQHPFYPFSGTTEVSSNIINTPLDANAGSQEFRNTVTHTWLPALENFQPQMLLISAGFDAHREDQMAQLNLGDEDYYWVSKQLANFADTNCNGRIVSMLEGGYAIEALGRSVVAHLRALL